jgi:hypothetical protein
LQVQISKFKPQSHQKNPTENVKLDKESTYAKKLYPPPS